MATPSPSPQSAATNPQAGAASDITNALGLNITPDGTSKKSAADKYGLGQWGEAQLNTSGLFDTATMTADDAMQKFLQWSQDSTKVGIVAAIQQSLYLSGAYPSTYQFLPGVVRSQDQSAFAKFLIQNAQMQGDVGGAAQKPIATVLQDNAQRGVAFGANAVKPQAQPVYQLPAVADLEHDATNAAEQVLGRKASPAEQAAFAAYYRHMVVNADTQIAGSKASSKAAAKAKRAAGLPPANDVNAQGIPLSAADQSAAAGQGAPAMSDAAVVSGLDSTNGLIQQNLQHATDPNAEPAQSTDPNAFLQHISDIAGVAQQQAVNTSVVPSPAFVDSAPSSSVAAEDYIRNANPGEAGANDMANTFNQFLKIISGKLV